jgi:uncharacterized membrane protein YccC
MRIYLGRRVFTGQERARWDVGMLPDFCRRELRWDLPRLRLAVKVAVGTTLGLAIGMLFHFNHFGWIAITVFVMTQMSVGASTERGVLRLLGTLLGAAFGILLTAQFRDFPAGYCVLFFLFFSACLYYSAGPDHPYAFFVCCLTMLLVTEAGFDQPRDTVAYAASRVLEIGGGIVIAGAVSILLWPVYVQDELRAKTAGWLRSEARMARSMIALWAGRQAPETRESFSDFRFDPDEMPGLFNLARQSAYESDAAANPSDDWTSIVFELELLLSRTQAVADSLAGGKGIGYQTLAPGEWMAFWQEMGLLCDALGEAFAHAQDRTEPPLAGRLDAAKAALERKVSEIASREEVFAFSVHDNGRGSSMYLSAIGMAASAKRLAASAAVLREKRDRRRQWLTLGMPAMPTLYGRWAVFDRHRFIHALKGGTVMLGLFLFGEAGAIPSTNAALISALVTLSITGIGADSRKALLRAVGAFASGVVAVGAMVATAPFIEHAGAALGVSFLLFFLCSYVYAGNAIYQFWGLQLFIALALILLAEPRDMFQLAPAIETAASIWIGAAASLLAITQFAPIYAARERCAALAGVYEQFRDVLADVRLIARGHSEEARQAQARWQHAILEAIQAASTYCRDAEFEGNDAPNRHALIVAGIRQTEDVLFRIAAAQDSLVGPFIEQARRRVGPPYDALARQLSRHCDVLARRLAGNFGPSAPLNSERQRQALEAALGELRLDYQIDDSHLETALPSAAAVRRLLELDVALTAAFDSFWQAFHEDPAGRERPHPLAFQTRSERPNPRP